MTAPVPRLRMFAGPNGSGKSTIKDMLLSEWLVRRQRGGTEDEE